MNEHEDVMRRNSHDGKVEDMEAKRKTFLELSLKFREKTRGRVRIPSEVLIREDRERGYRNI